MCVGALIVCSLDVFMMYCVMVYGLCLCCFEIMRVGFNVIVCFACELVCLKVLVCVVCGV